MEIVNLKQGSSDWHSHRANHFNASDAPAMMGCSKYTTRDELLAQIKTGLTKEVDAHTQRLFSDGHTFESLARPLAEELLKEELYPVVGTLGKYSASFDGMTIGNDKIFEHKSLNAELESIMSSGEAQVELPLMYRVQMEQQLMISQAEVCLFMASTWSQDVNTGEYSLKTERHRYYYPDLALREKIIAGWDMFEKDLETFVPAESKAMPKAEAIMALPALFINATAEITASNMKEYGEALKNRLAEVRSIVLVDDQDFSNAKAGAKQLREGMDQAKQALQAMTAQNTSFDEAKRMIESWIEDMRLTALKLEKDVEAEDRKKKAKMVSDAQAEYESHLSDLNEGITPIKLNHAFPDFAGAMKNKKNYDSMQSAINALLAQAKADANQVDMAIRAKQAWMKQFSEYDILFPDMQVIIFKAMDDFKLLVESRINTYKAKDAEIKANAEAAIKAEEVSMINRHVNHSFKEPSNLIAVPNALEQEFGKQFTDGLDEAYCPTRAELISDIAFLRKVSEAIAEGWLVNRFGAMEKAA